MSESNFVGLMGLKVQDGIMLPFYIFLVLNASLLLSRSLSDLSESSPVRLAQHPQRVSTNA
jgi:hypothetical protein